MDIAVLGSKDPSKGGGIRSVVRGIDSYGSNNFHHFYQGSESQESYYDLDHLHPVPNLTELSTLRVFNKFLWSRRAVLTIDEDFDLIHGHGDFANYLYFSSIDSPKILTAHQTVRGIYSEVYEELSIRNKLACFLKSILDKNCFKAADHIVAVSDKVKKEIVGLYDVPESKVSVIYNGVDPKEYYIVEKNKATRKMNIRGDAKYVGWVGANKHGKGLDKALNVIKELPSNYKLLVAGLEGKDTANCVYLGKVEPYNMSYFYGCLDSLLITSRYEGFGLTQLESLMCGVPVVASTNVAKLGLEGIEYTENKFSHILKSIDKKNKSFLREQAMQYSWDKQASKYEEIYAEYGKNL